MLHAKHLPYHFWAEAINTAYHVHNRVTLRAATTTTLYELCKGRKSTVKYFHVFGNKCYILADIFTKTLDVKQFERLRNKLGICLYEEL